MRRRAAEFDWQKFSNKEITKILREMRETMKAAEGIGLAANQVGLPWRLLVAELFRKDGKKEKFYAIFNPEIEKESEEKEVDIEGCLSVPGKAGEVERSLKVTISGQDRYGRKIRVKASGILARVFQHEMDHLNGVLFIDKAEKIYAVPEGEEGAPRA